MKQAIIDIGSNSMRLTLYEIKDTAFKVLFKERIMAGLAGYARDGTLGDDGVACACEGLRDFRRTLDSLGIKHVAVFATASLRNIQNTKPALAAIRVATGFSVEIVSGEEEALLGYTGALREGGLTHGIFVDIGGASTEIVSFTDGKATAAISVGIGSLNLYRQCVKKILPGGGSRKRLRRRMEEQLSADVLRPMATSPTLICVGGTARAVLKIAQRTLSLPEDCRTLSREQFEIVLTRLETKNRAALDTILKYAPDRIHTLLPGMMILRHLLTAFGAETISVGQYGVREGYLCQRILQSGAGDIVTPKIGS